MKATVSQTMAFCIIDRLDTNTAQLLSAITMEPLNISENRHALSLVNDWQVIEEQDERAILLRTKQMSMVLKCVSILRLRLILGDYEYSEWFYEQIESLLNHASADNVLNKLLVAPLKNPDVLKLCAQEALGNGFGAAGSLFNRLYDLQPVLNRFSNLWLKLPITIFAGATQAREEIWNELVDEGLILQVLEAPEKATIKGIFGKIAFTKSSPKERTSIAALGSSIANGLFEDVKTTFDLSPEVQEEQSRKHIKTRNKHIDRKAELERAQKEVDAISHAISIGDDHNAEKYLTELIDRQLEQETEHAVKSLCNIAARCADMFRTDFENICIERALQLSPNDAWTMGQMADVLKRQGKYKEAERMVISSLKIKESVIVRSLLADIHAQSGDKARAIDEYRNIPGWQSEPAIRTAIADNLRRLGKHQDALIEYHKLQHSGFHSARNLAGCAEIAKREGRISESLGIYKEIIESEGLDEKSLQIYQITYASILKQDGNYQEAISITEEVVSKAPFLMRARVLRSSLWGLLDNELAALERLPSQENYEYSAYGEWVREYTRGLLLLRTSRYKEAQKALLKNFNTNVLELDGREILRLASAVAFISSEDTVKAKELLKDAQNTHDSYISYLGEVLDYHIAIIENDDAKATTLFTKLLRRKSSNIILWSAVEALRDRRTADAIRFEVDALLRIAIAA